MIELNNPQKGDCARGTLIGYKSRNLYEYAPCEVCGKLRWAILEHGVPRRKRCRRCAILKSRSYMQGGYRMVYLEPDDFFFSMTASRPYVKEHRLVVAKALGRCLHSWEIVHHKHAKYPAGSIEDKQDNRYPENLQLVSDDRHKQITILETRIRTLENRVTLLEADNTILREQLKHDLVGGRLS